MTILDEAVWDPVVNVHELMRMSRVRSAKIDGIRITDVQRAIEKIGERVRKEELKERFWGLKLANPLPHESNMFEKIYQ